MVQTRFQTPPQKSCPTCGGALVAAEDSYTCPICGTIYEYGADRPGQPLVRKERTWARRRNRKS